MCCTCTRLCQGALCRPPPPHALLPSACPPPNSPSYISAAPDPAFLPLPDGEGARRSSAGPANMTLKQRRVSGSGSGSGAGSSGGGGGGGGAAPASPALAIARASGSSGSGGAHFFSATALSKLGSSVASYVSAVSAGGSSAAPEAAQEKDN
jgi:hypothetical protein